MFLKSFFNNNGFNDTIFFRYVRNFLNRKFTHQVTISGPKKQTLYLSFPYISFEMNKVLQKELLAIFKKYLPQIDLKLAIYNNYKIKSFFRCKEQLPINLCSSIVYLFSCPNCSLGYIGSSMKNLCLRVDQHKGVSTRTEQPLVRPPQSSVREHCHNTCHCNFNIKNFKIIAKASFEQELRITESILIKLKRPSLNIDGSAYPLYIF